MDTNFLSLSCTDTNTHTCKHTSPGKESEARSMSGNIVSQFVCECHECTGAGGGPPLSWKHQFLIVGP